MYSYLFDKQIGFFSTKTSGFWWLDENGVPINNDKFRCIHFEEDIDITQLYKYTIIEGQMVLRNQQEIIDIESSFEVSKQENILKKQRKNNIFQKIKQLKENMIDKNWNQLSSIERKIMLGVALSIEEEDSLLT